MAAVQISKTGHNIAALVDLFLSPDFEPLQKNKKRKEVKALPRSVQGYSFEADVGVEDDDVQSPQPSDEKEQVKAIAVLLAQSGDELYQGKVKKNVKELESIFKGDLAKDDVKEKAWTRFQNIMDDSIKGTGVDDVKMQLGAFLLALRSFRTVKQEVRQVASMFAQRFIADRQLDQALNNISSRELS